MTAVDRRTLLRVAGASVLAAALPVQVHAAVPALAPRFDRERAIFTCLCSHGWRSAYRPDISVEESYEAVLLGHLVGFCRALPNGGAELTELGRKRYRESRPTVAERRLIVTLARSGRTL